MSPQVKYINGLIKAYDNAGEIETDEVSDGYHDFGELYEFRKQYNAALFNEWAASHMELEAWKAQGNMTLLNPINKAKYDVHKSWNHHDEPGCFGEVGKWFIVIAVLPTGQISNHYKAKEWDLFKVPEVEKAKYQWDGHTSMDVAKRLNELNNS